MFILARSLRRQAARIHVESSRTIINAAFLPNNKFGYLKHDSDLASITLSTFSSTSLSTSTSSVSQPFSSPPKNALTLDHEHRTQMMEDLQITSTPTAGKLLKEILKDREERPRPPQAAVLLPLCHVAGVPSVAFANHPRDLHLKSLSFPSQVLAEGETSLVVTGLRAGFKELGVLPSNIQILGTQKEARDAANRVLITPVVAYIGEVQAGALSPGHHKSDVCSVVTVPIAELLSPTCLRYYDLEHPPWVSPSFSMDQGRIQMFGLPAMLLHGVLRVVVGRREEYMDVLYRPFVEAVEKAKMSESDLNTNK